MSRPVSSTFKAAAFSQETDQVYLVLFVIDHPELATPIRVVNNYSDITSNGNTYTGFPFTLVFPNDAEDAIPAVSLVIDNVDRQIVAAIRALSGPPQVTLSVVLAASPNTVEAGPYTLTLRDVSYDAQTVSGVISAEDMLNEAYPGDSITRGNFPGMF